LEEVCCPREELSSLFSGSGDADEEKERVVSITSREDARADAEP